MKRIRITAAVILPALLFPLAVGARIPAAAASRERTFTPYYANWVAVDEARIAAQVVPPGGHALLKAGEAQSFTLDSPRGGEYHLLLEYRPLSGIVLKSTLTACVAGTAVRTQLISLWRDVPGQYQTDRQGNELPADQETLNEAVLDYIRDQAALSLEPAVYPLKAGGNTLTLTSEDTDIDLLRIVAITRGNAPDYAQYAHTSTGKPVGTDNIIIEGEDYSVKSDSYIRAGAERNAALYPYDYKARLLNVLDGASFETVGQKVVYGFEVKTAGVYGISLRYSQNYKEDIPVYANLHLDGRALFAEMNHMPFAYTGIRYANATLSCGGQTAGVYLESGWHTLSLELDGTPVADAVQRLKKILADVSAIGLELKKVAGTNASEYRTWDLESYVPGLTEKLAGYRNELATLYEQLGTLQKSRPAAALNLRLAVDNLEKLLKSPNKIPANLGLFNEGSGSVAQLLSDQIDSLTGQNLSIDRIYVYPPDTRLPRAEADFFYTLVDGIKRFFNSLFVQEPDSQPDSDKSIRVWMNYPVYYMDTLQQMVDTRFTPQTGIGVQFSTMPDEQRVILSNATRSSPDVVMGVATKIPYDLGLRGAAVDLMQFEDFPEFIRQNYHTEAITPFMLDGQVFGVSETLQFYVLAYRRDILENLGLAVPDTWDDVAAMMPALRRNSMNFYLQLSGYSGLKPLYTTLPFLLQAGASLYGRDGLATAVNSREGLRGFETLTGLYKLYSVQPVVSSFYNSFRYGQIPIGIASFSDYVMIKNAAPEIAGLWEIAAPPGITREEGVDRSMVAASTACAILEQSGKREESWQFLKWWLSPEVQVQFGRTLQTTYGPEYLWNSANQEAFRQMAFPDTDKQVILDYWDNMREIPLHPALYSVERELSDAWSSVVLEGQTARIALDNAVLNIDREFRRKLHEFGYMDSEGGTLKPYPIYRIDDVLKGGAGVD
jgi:ABC-type glycerol-3-phosphate transport system substrate-binding protein